MTPPRAADPAAYYRRAGMFHPARPLIRIAGRRIRHHAERLFGGRLLDIGCGSKEKQLLVGDRVTSYIGIDMPDTAHPRGAIDAYATAAALPFGDGAFDTILCTAVLEHLADPPAAVAEATRVLKPGGYGLFTIPFFWHLHEEPRDFFRFTVHGIRRLFTRAGLEIACVEPLSGFLATFLVEFNYYLLRFDRGPLQLLVRPAILMNNLLTRLDTRRCLRDERFSWAYLVVVRKPVPAAAPLPGARP